MSSTPPYLEPSTNNGRKPAPIVMPVSDRQRKTANNTSRTELETGTGDTEVNATRQQPSILDHATLSGRWGRALNTGSGPSSQTSLHKPRTSSTNLSQVYRQPSQEMLVSDQEHKNPVLIPKAMRRQIKAIIEGELIRTRDPSEQQPQGANPGTMKRLEEKLKAFQVKLHERDCEILRLRQELHVLRKLIEESVTESKSSKTLYGILKYDLKNVEKGLSTLQDKVNEFELNPIHIRSSSSTSVASTLCNSTSAVSAEDYDKLIGNIRDLNGVVGNSSSMELCFNSHGATFKPATQSVELTLFMNGIQLDTDKQFRLLHTADTQSFLQDLLDGYFPSELQERFPNGIILSVNDKRTTSYTQNTGSRSASIHHNFSGKGRVLSLFAPDFQQDLPKILPGMKLNWAKPQNKSKLSGPDSNSSSSVNGSASSATELKQVLSSALVPSLASKSSVSVLRERLPDLLSNSNNNLGNSSRDGQLVTLRLKNIESNDKQYQLTVDVQSTIEEISRHLDKHIKSCDNNHEEDTNDSDWNNEDLEEKYFHRYQLINAVPFGRLANSSATLKEYKIVANCSMYFRRIRL